MSSSKTPSSKNKHKPVLADPETLPLDIAVAAAKNRIDEVLAWLGPSPVPSDRLNAPCREKVGRTLLHEAMYKQNLVLMHTLLRLGADVDPRSSFGTCPLVEGVQQANLLDEPVRVLLQWGAKNHEYGDNNRPSELALKTGGNRELAMLLASDYGGRRCELIGMEKIERPEWNGQTCIVMAYLPDDKKYLVTLEHPSFGKKQIKVRSKRLQRRDRTPQDPGYFDMKLPLWS